MVSGWSLRWDLLIQTPIRTGRLLCWEFPNILLENCSGGGARFAPPGMLHYSPQIWYSDDTDAIERLSIQEGTVLIYPLSTIGAHVLDCSNHTVGRAAPFEIRGHVALVGTFGYELDITKLSQQDRNMFPEQVAMYRRYKDLVREGDYYRIASYQEKREFDCWEVVSKDRTQILVTFMQVLGRANYHSRRVKLQGLDTEVHYQMEGSDRIFSADVLLYVGLPVENLWGDYRSKLIYLRKVSKEN